jgi:hypothetical protein
MLAIQSHLLEIAVDCGRRGRAGVAVGTHVEASLLLVCVPHAEDLEVAQGAAGKGLERRNLSVWWKGVRLEESNRQLCAFWIM